jgi:ACR3 family arsenite transporter
MLSVMWIVNRSQGWYERGANGNRALKPASHVA